jgi:ribosomal protein S18 acetylase RimI-like enzyme
MTYRFKIASTPQEFYDAAWSPLSRSLMPNNMILGVLDSLPDKSVWQTDATGALVFEGGTLVGAMLQTKPSRPLISEMNPETAWFAFEQWMKEIGPPENIFGPAQSVNAIIRNMTSRNSSWIESVTPMMAYELMSVDFPTQPARGLMRFACAGDQEILEKFVLGFYIDCNLPEARSPTLKDDVVKVVKRLLQNQSVVVWELDAMPVAIAAEVRRASFGSTVSVVYTPPEHRGHGYASALVAHLSQHLLNQGAPRCLLFTDANNPTSNAIYQRIGYRYQCDHVLLLNPPSIQKTVL